MGIRVVPSGNTVKVWINNIDMTNKFTPRQIEKLKEYADNREYSNEDAYNNILPRALVGINEINEMLSTKEDVRNTGKQFDPPAEKTLKDIIPAQARKTQYVDFDNSEIIYKGKSFKYRKDNNGYIAKIQDPATGKFVKPDKENLKKLGIKDLDIRKANDDSRRSKLKIPLANTKEDDVIVPLKSDSDIELESLRNKLSAEAKAAYDLEQAKKKDNFVERMASGKEKAKRAKIYESTEGAFNIADLFHESDLPTNQFKAENAIREPGKWTIIQDADKIFRYYKNGKDVSNSLTTEEKNRLDDEMAKTGKPDFEFGLNQKPEPTEIPNPTEEVKPDDSAIDEYGSLKKQPNKYISRIKDNIYKIATYGIIGGGLVTALGLLLRGGDSDDTDNNGSGGEGSAGSVPVIPAGSETMTDDQLKDMAKIKTLEKIAYGAPTVTADETYRNLKSEYDSKFKMNADKAKELMMNSNKKAIELANNMYDNTIVTFFDRIYQGLGMSNGQTGAVMLQNNQKLKADMGQLMEGSALLALSMGVADPGQAFKMRAEGARQIMDVVTPGTWDKIADNAIKAAAGLMSVAMHNATARQQAAERQISAITSKYTKEGKGNDRELESFKAMSKFLEAQVGTLDDPDKQKVVYQTMQNLVQDFNSAGQPTVIQTPSVTGVPVIAGVNPAVKR